MLVIRAHNMIWHVTLVNVSSTLMPTPAASPKRFTTAHTPNTVSQISLSPPLIPHVSRPWTRKATVSRKAVKPMRKPVNGMTNYYLLHHQHPTTIPTLLTLMLTSLVLPVKTPMRILVRPRVHGRLCCLVVTRAVGRVGLTQELERLITRL